ncbi:MAG: DUF2997 domain-containing protein [Candidatus Bathyarchaeia archaeon]
MRKIVFKFNPDGTVETEAFGFFGDECVKITEELLAELKPEVQKRKLKPEFGFSE